MPAIVAEPEAFTLTTLMWVKGVSIVQLKLVPAPEAKVVTVAVASIAVARSPLESNCGTWIFPKTCICESLSVLLPKIDLFWTPLYPKVTGTH